MAKQRYIDTKFWDDTYIITLDPVEKLLFLYLITNPLTNIAGIYEISLRRIAFDTGIDEVAVKNIFKRFKKEKKICYISGWIIISNFPKHQDWQKKPKIKEGIDIILRKIPDKVLKSIDTLSIPYTYPLNYSNTNTNTNNRVEKSTSSFKKIIDFFYRSVETKTGKKPILVKKDFTCLKAHLKKSTEEETKKIITWYINTAKFKEYPTLSACLSAHSVNLFNLTNKQDWQSK